METYQTPRHSCITFDPQTLGAAVSEPVSDADICLALGIRQDLRSDSPIWGLFRGACILGEFYVIENILSKVNIQL